MASNGKIPATPHDFEAQLAAIAVLHGMRLAICSQLAYCAAGAAEARDIGDYDTCPHGCVYCYAVRNRALARRRYAGHDPAGEFLFAPTSTAAGSG